MCPRVGFSKPSSSLTVVDLPEPFGPSRPKTSPRRTSKSTLSTARALGRFQKSLKTFVRPRTETTTSPFDVWEEDIISNVKTLHQTRREAEETPAYFHNLSPGTGGTFGTCA